MKPTCHKSQEDQDDNLIKSSYELNSRGGMFYTQQKFYMVLWILMSSHTNLNQIHIHLIIQINTWTSTRINSKRI